MMLHYSIRRLLIALVLLSFVVAAYFSARYIITPAVMMTATDKGLVIYDQPECDVCSLEIGDIVVAIEGVEYEPGVFLAPFAGFTNGDVVNMSVLRGGERVEAQLRIPASDGSEVFVKLLVFVFWMPFWLSAAWLAYFAPLDKRAITMAAMFSVYAVWVVAGLVSSAFVSAASVVVHVATWMLVPLTVQVHWVSPSPLHWRVPRWTAVGFHGVFAVLVVAELFQMVPRQLFTIGTVLMVLAPFVLLPLHRDKARLNARRMMLMGVVTLTVPLVAWLLISFNTETSSSASSVNLMLVGGSALLALPVFPLLYVYANYRQYFSAKMEQRSWRVLVLLVYISLILVAITAAITVAGRSLSINDQAINLSLITSTIIGVAVALGTNSAQSWMKRFTYGDFESRINLASVRFSTQMTELTAPGDLEAFLAAETHAQLGVTASALYLASPELVLKYVVGAAEGATKAPETISPNNDIVAGLGKYRPYVAGSSLPWARLCIPLLVEKDLVGVWLLGPRENDDFYAAGHIQQLQALGNQVAAVVEMRRQQREIERQVATLLVKEKEAALGRVVTSVAHQFRNPLQVIMGALEADNDYQKPENEWLALAYQRAERLSDVVRSIQRFATINDPGNEAAQRIDVQEAVKEAMLLIEHRLKEQGITLALEDGEPCFVMMGASELTQAVLNLLENASDAQEGGCIHIEVSQRNGTVVLRVRDEGAGIADGDIERVFEPLFTTKNGLGLGLWITRSIIERNRGTISAQSALGKGSVFTITLPAV
jgi:signal transduction histidine kinase